MTDSAHVRPYDFIRYNRYGVLRPGAGLWLALVFLCRHIMTILLVAMAAGRGPQGGAEGIDLSDFGHLVTPVFMVADLPALALLLALAARLPTASALPRLVWRAGRPLLLVSVLVYSALIVRHWPAAGVAGLAAGDWLGFAGTLAVAVYAATSPYLADLFREFPECPVTQDPRP